VSFLLLFACAHASYAFSLPKHVYLRRTDVPSALEKDASFVALRLCQFFWSRDLPLFLFIFFGEYSVSFDGLVVSRLPFAGGLACGLNGPEQG
jgi:hypothetical protein